MDLTLCLVQPNLVWESPDENLVLLEEMLAADKNACDIILLPEMFSTGFSMNAALLAEEAGGRTMRWMEKLANTTNAWVLGSYIIRENNQFFNRMVCMAPGGTYKQYDKRHLFSLAAEEKTYSPGKERIFVSVKGWKIVPLICYDLRFPVWSRNTDDFDLLIYLANWPKRRRYAWNTLLKARAIENQSFVAGVNRVGYDGNRVEHSGDSCVLNPLGKTLSKLSNKSGVIYAELSKVALNKTRSKFTFLNDRDDFKINVKLNSSEK